MPPLDKPRVFISYARKDGAALAQRLQKDLNGKGFDVWLDTQRIAGGATWTRELDAAIDSCQVMLAVLTKGSYESRMCSGEQLRALDNGKRLIPLLAEKGADRTTYLYALRLRDFTNDADYPARLTELISDIRGDATAILPDTYRETRVTYLTAPPRVANYLERPEALRALRDTLFAEDHRQPIALTALAGMGGIGKTVLAKALTDDEVVRRAFPDGIVWITAGKERKGDFAEEMRQVADVLGDDGNSGKKVTNWQDEYRIRIANKAALIVVDDVWSKADIEPLLAESPRSRFLFTTRDAAIGNLVGARDHRADLLDDAQSRELLALWANQPFAELPAVADEIIHECGRLPLALSVLGGMLRGKNAQYWADTLAGLRKADISSIRKQLPTGQETFFKAVETSFQSLEPEMQEQYKALAVLLEDMPAPLPILATLWNVDACDTRLISNRLVELSLAQLEGATESIRLHDLQLDYVRAQYPDKEALELIHGAVRLSSHVIANDPEQFASQMVGRLLSYQDTAAIADFTTRVVEGTHGPWLRPLHPALHPPGTALIRTLAGHTSSVNAVAATPDGRWAVSASSDQTLRVWDLGSGRELRTLAGHAGSVNAVAVTPDGQRAVSASDDQTLKVWELATGRKLRTLSGHSSAVRAVAVTPDGQRAVSAADDNNLIVWNLENGRQLHTLSGHTNLHVPGLDGGAFYFGVHSIAVTADGGCAISAGGDGTLKLWDLNDGREIRSMGTHFGPLEGTAVTADGLQAVSVSRDGTLKVWELSTGRELRSVDTGHTRGVSAVAVTPNGQQAITGSYDRTLKVWDLASGRELYTLTGHSEHINAVSVSKNGRRAFSAAGDGTVKMWDLENSRRRTSTTVHMERVSDVRVSGDGRRAVSASWDHTLKVWDVEAGRELYTLSGDSSGPSSVAISDDSQFLVSGWNGKLRVWCLETGADSTSIDVDFYSLSLVDTDRTGSRVAFIAKGGELTVWNPRTDDVMSWPHRHDSVPDGLALSQDGNYAISAAYDELKLWDCNTGQELRTLGAPSHWIYDVALSGDGKLALSASRDTTLRVWDAERGTEVRTIHGHSHWVNGVALSGNTRVAVSGSEDKSVKMWSIDTGQALASLACDAPAICCAISNDGSVVVAADAGGHVHFLRLEEPKKK